MEAGSRGARALWRTLRGALSSTAPPAAPLCAHSAALLPAAARHAWSPALAGPGRFGLLPAAAAARPPAAWRGFAAAADSLKVYKPTSPGQRGRVTTSRVGLHKGAPIKALTVGLSKSGGRNNLGRITSRHRGGGAKRLYRMVDFARSLSASKGVVVRLEYDPNRSARIALVDYSQPKPAGTPVPAPNAKLSTPSSQLGYMLAPEGLKAGDPVQSGASAGIFVGSAMPMRDMPAGTVVHNVEMRPGGGGQLCRAAGTSATLIKKGDDGYVVVRLASGELRRLREECGATVGVVGNKEHHNRKLGKAGISRYLGRRPHVRGVAMNPVDHPHGGGEGKTSGGRPSVTPWGRPTKGYRTRKNKRTDKDRVQRRPDAR